MQFAAKMGIAIRNSYSDCVTAVCSVASRCGSGAGSGAGNPITASYLAPWYTKLLFVGQFSLAPRNSLKSISKAGESK